MPLVPARCTQCGAELQVDNTHDTTVCQYCNTPFIIEKAINNYNTYITQNFAGANITIKNQDLSSILKRCEQFIADKNWGKAEEYIEKALDINPENGMAWLYKLLAECQVISLIEAKQRKIDISTYGSYDKAVKYLQNPYKDSLISTVEYVSTELDKDNQDRLNSEIAQIKTELENMKQYLKSCQSKRKVNLTVFVLSFIGLFVFSAYEITALAVLCLILSPLMGILFLSVSRKIKYFNYKIKHLQMSLGARVK